MFRNLATWYESRFGNGAERVFTLHPIQHMRFLEEMWLMRVDAASRPSAALPRAIYDGSGIASDLGGLAGDIYPTTFDAPIAGDNGTLTPFRHLMYAYLIENTRVY